MMRCVSALLANFGMLTAVNIYLRITYLLDHDAAKRVCDENDGSLSLLELVVSRPAPNVGSRGQPLTS